MSNQSYYVLCALLIIFFLLITRNHNIEFFQALVKRDE